MRFLFIIALIFCGCTTRVPPIPTVQPSAPQLGASVAKKDSMVSASISVAEENAQNVAQSPAKDATLAALRVGKAWAGPYSDADRAQLMALAATAAAKGLDAAQSQIDQLTKKGTEQQAEIERLKKQVETERQNAAKEWQEKLDQARQEAKKARDRFIMSIFFGLGALLTVGGIVIFVLAGQFAAIYPALGPKAAFAVGGSGLVLISLGIAINAIENALEAHPWIVGIGCGVSILLVAVGAALIYGNHHHAVTAPKNT